MLGFPAIVMSKAFNLAFAMCLTDAIKKCFKDNE
jgi:hypothetical protein